MTLPIWKVNKTAELRRKKRHEEEMVGIQRCTEDQRRSDIFLLGFFSYCALESSSDSVGKQLSGRSKGNFCGTCSSLCVPVLHRYHTWKISGRFYYRKNGRPQDDSVWASAIITCWMYSVCCYRYPSMTFAALFGLVIMGTWLCTDLSIYHPCNTFQFRREELPGDHRYPDGK